MPGDAPKHMVLVPGPLIDKWCYAVEAKLATDQHLPEIVNAVIDHAVLYSAYTDPNCGNPENILSAIFLVDDEYLDLYFKVIRGERK